MGGAPRRAGGLAHVYCLSAFQAEFGYGDEVAYTVTVPAALDTACGNDTRERNTCHEWFSRLATSYSAPS